MNAVPESSLVWTCAPVCTSTGAREGSTKSLGSLAILSPSISDTQAHFASHKSKQAQQVSKESYTSPNIAWYSFCCCSSDLHPKEPHLPKSKCHFPSQYIESQEKLNSVHHQKAKKGRTGRRSLRRTRKKDTRLIQTWCKARVPRKSSWVVHRARWHGFDTQLILLILLAVTEIKTYIHLLQTPFYSTIWGRHGIRRFHALQSVSPVTWITQNSGSILGSSNS